MAIACSSQARTPIKASGSGAASDGVTSNPSPSIAARLPQPLDWRMQKLFPGMRPDCVAKHRGVVAALEAVFAGLLAIGPADRQLIEIGHGVVEDSPVANGRRDHAIAAISAPPDQSSGSSVTEPRSSIPTPTVCWRRSGCVRTIVASGAEGTVRRAERPAARGDPCILADRARSRNYLLHALDDEEHAGAIEAAKVLAWLGHPPEDRKRSRAGACANFRSIVAWRAPCPRRSRVGKSALRDPTLLDCERRDRAAIDALAVAGGARDGHRLLDLAARRPGWPKGGPGRRTSRRSRIHCRDFRRRR